MVSIRYKFLAGGAAILLALLVACSTGSTSTPIIPTIPSIPAVQAATPTASAVPATAAPATAAPASSSLLAAATPAIQSLDMLDLNNGWALTDTAVIRTTDGGVTWLTASPSGLSGSPSSAFFLDASTAWLAEMGADPTTGALFHTSDGGATWSSVTVPFGGGSMQFLDRSNGWVLVGLGAGMSHAAVAVFRTSDGGNNWSQVFTDAPTAPGTNDTLPFAGDKTGLTAIDTTHAWVTGAEPVNDLIYIYTTQDGGHTWSAQNPAVPAGYAGTMTNAFPPHFFSATEGVLPVGLYANTSATVLYLSHDGGQTWTASQPVVANGQVFLVSQMDSFVWDGGSILYASHNAGASWTTIRPNVNLKDNLVSFQFVNATTGWALTSDASSHHKLYKTTDGGATWTVLIP